MIAIHGARRSTLVLLLLFAALASTAPGAEAQVPSESSGTMSLDSLLNIRISSASRYAQVAARAPAFVTIVTAEDIESYGYATVDEVLQSVPGFYVSSDRNYSYIGTRGFSRPTDYNNRVLMLVNDVVQNETYYNSTYGGRTLGVDLRTVERIEIVRGPASALYGTSAMFAVINVVTKPGSTLDGGYIQETVGSYGYRETSASVGGVVGGVDVAGSVTRGSSDGPDLYFRDFDEPALNDGIAEGLDWERYESLLLRASKGALSVQALASSRRKGIPTASWGTTFNGDGSSTKDAWLGGALSYTRSLGPSLSWSARALAGTYDYHGWYTSDVVYEDANKGAWGSVGSQLAWDVAPGHRLLAGGDLQRTARARYLTKADGVETDDHNFPFSTWSVYVADELTVSSVFTLLAGLRKDGHSAGAGSASPRLGLIVTPGRSTTAKLLWGRGFRTPTVYEREYNKALHPAEVRPERIRTTELVLEQRLGGSVQLTASIFDNHVRELIDQTVDDVDAGPYFTNLSEAQTRGIEALVQTRLSGGLTGYAGYAYTDTKDPSTDEGLSNASPHQLKVGGATPRSFGVLALEGRYEAGRRTVLGTETDDALVVNGAFTSRPVFGGLRMTARVTDLFDSGFSVPGGFEHAQSAIPQGPRAISFGLGYSW